MMGRKCRKWPVWTIYVVGVATILLHQFAKIFLPGIYWTALREGVTAILA